MTTEKTDIRLWIANLGKYNEGESVGEWFTLPVEWEEVAEAIGLNAQYEEWAIHDYEAPFAISEYASIDKLNEIAEAFDRLTEEQIQIVVAIVGNNCASDIMGAIEGLDDVIIYEGCEDMQDVARYQWEESGKLARVIEVIGYESYIDWESVAEQIESDGSFFTTEDGLIFEYTR
jgi:antirestriction protein